jgi:hypothetical protein
MARERNEFLERCQPSRLPRLMRAFLVCYFARMLKPLQGGVMESSRRQLLILGDWPVTTEPGVSWNSIRWHFHELNKLC